jgi:hypothetical protein
MFYFTFLLIFGVGLVFYCELIIKLVSVSDTLCLEMEVIGVK